MIKAARLDIESKPAVESCAEGETTSTRMASRYLDQIENPNFGLQQGMI
jgi:hypothetical protein